MNFHIIYRNPIWCDFRANAHQLVASPVLIATEGDNSQLNQWLGVFSNGKPTTDIGNKSFERDVEQSENQQSTTT